MFALLRAPRRLFLLLAPFVICGVFVFAGAASARHTQRNLTYALEFRVDGLHAPFFAADSLGYYKKRDLTVNIQTSTGSAAAVSLVAAGQAQMGEADAATVLNGIAKGLPIKVVGVLLLHNALSVEVLSSSNIQSLKDLPGHSVGITPTGAERALFPALMAVNHIPTDSIKQTSIPGGNAVLLTGQVDAVNYFAQVFANNLNDVRIFPYYKNGIDIYGTVIIANTDFLKHNPGTVGAFLQGSMQGLNWVLDNPVKAGAVVANITKGDPFFYYRELTVLRPYWQDPKLQGIGLGYMTDKRWKTTQDLNVSSGLQTSALPLTQIYTNTYLGKPIVRKIH